MGKTEYMVYWTSACGDGPSSSGFHDMSEALEFMQFLRKHPENKFITMASECVDNVGKMGVTAVEDGKTPDGEDYTWSKAHRAGGTRGVPHSIIDNKSNE